MLVVTRKAGERILIGDDIVITIVDIKGDSIRLGVDAPRSMRIERSERIDWIAEETRAASRASDADADALIQMLSGETGAQPTSD